MPVTTILFAIGGFALGVAIIRIFFDPNKRLPITLRRRLDRHAASLESAQRELAARAPEATTGLDEKLTSARAERAELERLLSGVEAITASLKGSSLDRGARQALVAERALLLDEASRLADRAVPRRANR